MIDATLWERLEKKMDESDHVLCQIRQMDVAESAELSAVHTRLRHMIDDVRKLRAKAARNALWNLSLKYDGTDTLDEGDHDCLRFVAGVLDRFAGGPDDQ